MFTANTIHQVVLDARSRLPVMQLCIDTSDGKTFVYMPSEVIALDGAVRLSNKERTLYISLDVITYIGLIE